jgi:hypothetical protein
MAYARYHPPESEVYVISAGKGTDTNWECISCHILPAVRNKAYEYNSDTGSFRDTGEHYWHPDTFCASTPGQMLTHLLLHNVLGDAVPEYALARLRKEEDERVAENTKYWTALAQNTLPEEK